MKKQYILILFFTTLVFGGCRKFLDKRPNDSVDKGTFYKSQSDLELATRSVYNTLQGVYGGAAHYAYGWGVEESYGDRSAWKSVFPNTYNLNASNDNYRNVWATFYSGIKEANSILKALENKPKSISDSMANQYKGESLFLRGYYYFMLTQLFGGVPLRLTPVESVSEVQIPKSSIKEVYTQVLNDMREAENLVPDITNVGYGGRVSKSAVRGILARVNLVMAGHPLMETSRYDSVKYWCKKLMDDPIAGHALNPDRNQIFINYAADKYDIKESIWEVEYWGNKLIEPYKLEGGMLGSGIGPGSNNDATGVSYGYSGITRKMSDIFNGYPGDMRKYWNIAFFEYIGGGLGYRTQVNYPQFATSGVKDYYTFPITGNALYRNAPLPTKWAAYRPGKFRREYETYTPKGPRDATPQNFPLLRYTDILLMYAEAENEINGPTDEAVRYVNMVRERGWSTGIVDDGIQLINGGSGYSAARPPVVTISGGGGTGVKATATVNASGVITAVNLMREDSALFYNRGWNFTSIPTITITDPGGSGSGATAVVKGVYNKSEAAVPNAAKASKAEFRAFIQDERFRELCNECLRKFDLIRWGIFVETAVNYAAQIVSDGYNSSTHTWMNYGNVTARDTLWPIPALEISANPTVTQNPGWF